MENLNTSLQGLLSANGSERKRKVSENSTSASSLDSDLDDFSESREAKKIALLQPNERVSTVPAPVQQEEVSSDSENEEIEKCPICLKDLTDQTLSITDRCNRHAFCLSCLQEWSKSRRTCPVDRRQYQSILELDTRGYVVKRLPIVPLLRSALIHYWPTQPTLCEICELSVNQEQLLICDRCCLVFHRYCRDPPMGPETTPPGLWLCNECCGEY